MKSAWAPLARPVFRALWIASFVSNLGSWMESVGAQWFLVAAAAPAIVIALVQTASLVPTALFSLPAGVLADSMSRKLLLVSTTIGSTAISVALTITAVTGTLSPPLLLFLTFLLGVSGALVGPAWQAIQPDLVPRDEIRAAAGLGGISVNASRAIGPAIAGVIVGLTGPWVVFALDALSFGVIVIALARWNPETRITHQPERFVESMRAGVRYVISAGLIRRILLRSALFAFPASALWAVLPLSATRLGLDSVGYGILLGLLGLGAAVGIVLLPLSRRILSDSMFLAVSAIGFGLGTAAAAIAPLPVVAPALVIAGAAWTASLTVLNSAMQLTLAEWVRARGLAIYVIVFFGANAVGATVTGWLADAVGLIPTLLSAAIALVVVGLSVKAFPLLPQTSEIDRSVTLAWSVPALMFEPQPQDGPVTVTYIHQVTPDKAEAFVEAMREVRQSRRRTGATRWSLFRDAESSDRFIEQFDVPSWSEYLRSNTERFTGKDREFLETALRLSDGQPVAHYYFPAEHRHAKSPS